MHNSHQFQTRRRQTLGLIALGTLASTCTWAQTSSATIPLPVGATPAPAPSVSLPPGAVYSDNPLKNLPFLTDISGSMPAPVLAAKAWIALDASSAQLIGGVNPDARIEPASITKVMAAYLVFQALQDKRISLEQEVVVTPQAAATEGSRMFLVPNKPVTVENLIRGMIVQSGNDATVTLAEAVSGTESSFVNLMNSEAKRLGLTSTNFTNASGLPDPLHYTSVRDLAWLAHRFIVDFPEQYAYYKEKSFTWSGITQPNRNRLLFTDPSVDGFKTGHTDSAGYCLIASALRDGRRVITVLVGAANEAARAQESQKLLNWSFMNFEGMKLFDAGQPVVADARVWKGVSSSVNLGSTSAIWATVPKGLQGKLEATVERVDPIIAPVIDGQVLGNLHITVDKVAVKIVPLNALSGVTGAGVFGRAIDSIRIWFN